MLLLLLLLAAAAEPHALVPSEPAALLGWRRPSPMPSIAACVPQGFAAPRAASMQ
jgi:hypothetical protein